MGKTQKGSRRTIGERNTESLESNVESTMEEASQFKPAQWESSAPEASADQDQESTGALNDVKRLGSRAPRAIAVLILLALVVYLAPWLIGRSPWAAGFVRDAVGPLKGELKVEGVSLGWFSSPQVSNLQLFDSDGNLVVSAERVTVGRSLLALAMDRSDLGEISIANWSVDLEVRDGTTNLEEVLQPLLEQESTAPPPRFRLVAEQGTCRLQAQGESLELSDIGFTVVSSEADVWEIELKQGSAEESSSRLLVSANLKLASHEEPTGFSGDLSFEGESLPLSLVTIAASRLEMDWQASGWAALKGQVQFEQAGASGRISVSELIVDQGRWTSPELLQSDVIALDRVEAHGGCAWAGTRLEFESTELRTSIGGGAIRGFVDFEQWQAWWQDSTDGLFESSGELELGPLLAMLPQTMSVREGVAVSQGNLAWTTHSRREGAKRRMLVDLRTTPVTLVNAGRSIPWETPVIASLAIVGSAEGPVLEFINIQGPSLVIEGQGSASAGSVTVRGDLAGLYQPISQVVDLGVTECAGGIEGSLLWGADRERTASGSPADPRSPGVGFGGELRLSGILVRSNQGPIWQDPEINIGFGGRWLSELSFPDGLRPFWANVDARSDSFSLQTQEVTATGVRGEIGLRGSLDRWLARLGASTVMPGHTLSGEIEARGNLEWNRQGIELHGLNYAIQDVRLEGPDLQVREPEVVGEVHAVYEMSAGSARLERATLAASAFSASLGRFQLFDSNPESAIGGAYAIRANLEPLMSFVPSWRSSGMRMTGAMEGNGTIQMRAGRPWVLTQQARVADWSLAWISTGQGLLGQAGNSTWREPQLQFEFEGAFDPSTGRLAIARGLLDGEGQKLALEGSLALYDGRWPANLQGELTMRRHDWVALLRPWIGEDAQLTGVHARPLATQGPMILGAGTDEGPRGHWPPRSLRSSAAIAWDSGQVLGIPFGEGELQANLAEKVLDFGNFRLPLGSGQLQMASRISFERPTPRLVIDQGRVLENVELTPEACRQWVMYAAPIFATATAVRGAIDLDVQGCELPLDNPLLGTGSGTVHVKEAAIGPGPLIEQLLTLVRSVRSLGGATPPNNGSTQWAMLPEQQVQFQLRDGRVFHDRLMASVGDVAWYTSGSVGADQSIDLVAVIPVQDSWVANRPQLAMLKGIEIRVPIRGTLTRPQVDSQVLAQLGRQLAEQAAGRVIEDQIQRGLGRLFGGQQ